jgi:integrase
VLHRETDAEPEAVRRRRATANRVLTILKAALNHARIDGKVSCPPDAWADVKPFREADAPKVRYLNDDEIARLVNACGPDLRELVTGALVTGCRYGELAMMTVADFDQRAGTLTVGRSKSGKKRHVALPEEGREFFVKITACKSSAARIFEREFVISRATGFAPAKTKRAPWGKSQQFRPLKDACDEARITPAVSFHILRHTYASRLAQRGVLLPVIAAQLGHSGTRMTERHYAHLSGSYVADILRAGFGTLGIGTTADATAPTAPAGRST